MEVKLDNTLTTHLSEYNTQAPAGSVTPTATRQNRDYTIPPTAEPPKRTCTLGKPEGLLPNTIVPKNEQEWAVAQINANPVNHRIIVRRHKESTKEHNKGTVRALIGHFESVWWAWWQAPDKTYMYGCTVMMKDTHAVRTKVFENGRHAILRTNLLRGYPLTEGPWETHGFQAHDMDQIKIGRSGWLHKQIQVSSETISKGFTFACWGYPHICNSSHGKAYEMNKIIREIRAQISNSIVRTWRDSTGLDMFERFLPKNNTLYYCLTKLRCRRH